MFLYPNKSSTPKSVNDLRFDGVNLSSDLQDVDVQDEPLNFVLLDGTWSNSAALYRRLKIICYRMEGSIAEMFGRVLDMEFSDSDRK